MYILLLTVTYLFIYVFMYRHIYTHIYTLYMYIYTYVFAIAIAKSLQSCPTLCNLIDGSPQGFPIPGIFQARALEWVAISFSNAWKWKVKSESEVAQSCPTLSNPMDCSLPGSSLHGIFQARVLEWGAIALSDIYIYIHTCKLYAQTRHMLNKIEQ